ncbi:MAG: hypothetical protein H7288_12390 [Kineosporiaceae bacterium]|nr:hypothetical protein [Aeromicrobium sp.]
MTKLLASSDPMPWWTSLNVLSNDGTTMVLKARSPIGYTVGFRVHDLVATKPDTLTCASDGDPRGSGSTTFRSASANACILDFRWNVSVDRAWMRASSPVLRPMFVLGHDLVMAQGEKNLNEWLATRGRG